MRNRQLAAMVAGTLAIACARAPSSQPPSSEPTNVFAAADDVEEGERVWIGRVEERLEAGPYTYLLIERPGEVSSWVATLRTSIENGDRVRVHVVKKSERFESKRLARTFSPLHFAMIRKDEI